MLLQTEKMNFPYIARRRREVKQRHVFAFCPEIASVLQVSARPTTGANVNEIANHETGIGHAEDPWMITFPGHVGVPKLSNLQDMVRETKDASKTGKNSGLEACLEIGRTWTAHLFGEAAEVPYATVSFVKYSRKGSETGSKLENQSHLQPSEPSCKRAFPARANHGVTIQSNLAAQ